MQNTITFQLQNSPLAILVFKKLFFVRFIISILSPVFADTLTGHILQDVVCLFLASFWNKKAIF